MGVLYLIFFVCSNNLSFFAEDHKVKPARYCPVIHFTINDFNETTQKIVGAGIKNSRSSDALSSYFLDDERIMPCLPQKGKVKTAKLPLNFR